MPNWQCTITYFAPEYGYAVAQICGYADMQVRGYVAKEPTVMGHVFYGVQHLGPWHSVVVFTSYAARHKVLVFCLG